MKSFLRNTCLGAVSAWLLSTCGHAQSPQPQWPTTGYEVQPKAEAFHTWRNSLDDPKQAKGWKSSARWFWLNEARTPRNGDISVASRGAYEHLLRSSAATARTAGGGNWDNLGFPAPLSNQFSGRINCIAADPGNPSLLYVGTPDGGLWSSGDAGQTAWGPLTDFTASLGVSAIAIDPVSSATIYIGTGDADADGAGVVSDSRSVGILKTTDGGATWSTTGLNWTVQQPTKVSRIIIDGTTNTTLIAATGTGIMRSTDAGANWATQQSGVFRELIQDGSSSTRWYAASETTVYYSTDDGVSWTPAGVGLPGNAGRIALATTTANPNYVYALVVDNNGNNLGIYRSTDMGLNFSPRNTADNLVMWAGKYNLVLAASNTNAEHVYGGGVILSKSTDGGATWDIGINGNFVDHHALVLTPTGEIWVGADQGIYRSTDDGATWQHRNSYLDVFQHYRLGIGQGANQVAVTGTQDNGSHFYANGTWGVAVGGDGTGAAVDQVDPNLMYTASYAAISRSTNLGVNWTHNINSSITGEPNHWVLPITTDPLVTGTVYTGFVNVYKSTNQGMNWAPISSFTPLNVNNTVISIAIAPSSSSHIYVVKRDSVLRTTNGGTNWSNITAGLSNGTYTYTDVWVHSTNPDIAWVSVSGWEAGTKVFKTTDGGSNWTNISAGLQNIPANAGVHAPGSSADIYLGMDDGVYHYNDGAGIWTRYSNYLPRAIVTDIVVNNSLALLFASTYGRGCWFSPLGLVANDAPTTQSVEMTVFPNPSSGTWSMRYDLGRAKAGQFRVYGLSGQVLHEERLNAPTGTLRSSEIALAKGLYILRLDTEFGTQTQKLVVR